MGNHALDQWNGTTSVQDNDSNDAMRFKDQAGIQRESKFVLTPCLQGLRDQRGAHVLPCDVLVCQPTAKTAFSALGSSGLSLDAANPVGWVT